MVVSVIGRMIQSNAVFRNRNTAIFVQPSVPSATCPYGSFSKTGNMVASVPICARAVTRSCDVGRQRVYIQAIGGAFFLGSCCAVCCFFLGGFLGFLILYKKKNGCRVQSFSSRDVGRCVFRRLFA